MRRFACVFLLILTIAWSILSAYAEKVPVTRSVFSDSESGVVFTIPDGWKQVNREDEENQYYVSFQDGKDSIFVFSYADMWEILTDEEKKSHEPKKHKQQRHS